MEAESDPDSGLGVVDIEEAEVDAPPASHVQPGAGSAEASLPKQELSILESAVRVITRHQEPVPYREFLNKVYADLLDHDMDFQSVRQIETTLLKHLGRELILLDGLDNATGLLVKKWWLGQKGVDVEEGSHPNVWKTLSRRARPGLPKVRRFLTKWHRQKEQPGYQPKKPLEDD